jgi:predicted O-methyltransferase YrrM
LIKRRLKNIPFIKNLYSYLTKYPPGHYYSPIVNGDEILKNQSIFKITQKEIKGIELNEKYQLELLDQLSQYFNDFPYNSHQNKFLRYSIKNSTYGHADSIYLFSMMNYFKPHKIVEIGSGYSSALMVDTNEKYFDNNIELTFIDPNPKRLESLLRKDDYELINLIPRQVQNVPIDIFSSLTTDDLLFIDSSHVSKTGSDVNDILFRILPSLKPGVVIHFHDIFFPFEYPKNWVLMDGGFGWNEAYFLKAFLMYNNHYEIILFSTFLEHYHYNWYKDKMPISLSNPGGNIWIRKL